MKIRDSETDYGCINGEDETTGRSDSESGGLVIRFRLVV